MIDITKVDNIVWDGIDTEDYPDFCDAYIQSADYDGRPMTEEELIELQQQDQTWCYEKLMDHIF
jgi:hypothetical protein